MLSIDEFINAYLSIVWSSEFDGISIRWSCLQSENAYDPIILINDGIVISLMSRRQKMILS